MVTSPVHIVHALVLLLVLCTGTIAHAQQSAQRFVVDMCPEGSPLTEAQLNERLIDVDSRTGVEHVFRKVFLRGMTEGVYFHENMPDERVTSWVYYIPSGNSASAGMRTLGTRDVYSGPLRDEQEVNNVFTDSLAVLGELELVLGERIPSDVAEGYFLYWAEPDSDAFRRVALPLEQGALHIGTALFPDIAGDKVEVVLRNSTAPDEVLGHAILQFIPPPVERHLRVMMCEAMANIPGSTVAQQRSECLRLMQEWYGRVYPANALRVACTDR